METISMIKLTNLLKAKGIKAEFEMSGGNCGTIYFGDFDEEGYAEFAVGPSRFYEDQGFFGDLYWGLDDGIGDVYFKFDGEEKDFTEENLAELIFNDYKKIKENN